MCQNWSHLMNVWMEISATLLIYVCSLNHESKFTSRFAAVWVASLFWFSVVNQSKLWMSAPNIFFKYRENLVHVDYSWYFTLHVYFKIGFRISLKYLCKSFLFVTAFHFHYMLLEKLVNLFFTSSNACKENVLMVVNAWDNYLLIEKWV